MIDAKGVYRLPVRDPATGRHFTLVAGVVDQLRVTTDDVVNLVTWQVTPDGVRHGAAVFGAVMRHAGGVQDYQTGGRAIFVVGGAVYVLICVIRVPDLVDCTVAVLRVNFFYLAGHERCPFRFMTVRTVKVLASLNSSDDVVQRNAGRRVLVTG